MSLYEIRGVEAIIDRQMRRWALQRSSEPTTSPSQPVVTVSRQYAARGSELARGVAARLSYSCWDQELVHRIAENSRSPAELYTALDEHAHSGLAEWIDVFVTGSAVTSSDYMTALVKVVHAIAERGSAVIVGRGSQYLMDSSRSLRLRVIGALDDRITRVMDRRQIPRAEAEQLIAAVDRERRAFTRENYDRDPDDPAGYDLVLNTSSLSLEQAVDIAVAAHHVRFATLGS